MDSISPIASVRDMAPSASCPKPRDMSVDMVKGMAITLVVFGHTLQGMIHRAWWATPESAFIDAFIYSFHMPAFFFVSGLFVGKSMKRRTSAQFLFSKFETLLYPYLLWLFIDMAQQPLTAHFRSSSVIVSPLSYFRQALMGNQSWFLECLFLCMVLTLLTARLPDWLRALLAMLVCVATPVTGITAVDYLVREWAFVAIGQLVGSRIATLEQLRKSYATIVLLGLICVQLAAVMFLSPVLALSPQRSRLLFLFLGLAGTAGLFCVTRILYATKLAVLIAWTGEASIAIYVLSPFVQGGTREAILLLFHTHLPLPHLLLTTAVATLGPAWLWHQRLRLHIGWLFRWGSERASKPEAVAAAT